MNKHILIADDDAAVVTALNVLLESEGYSTTTANTTEQIIFLVKQRAFDLVLLDMNYQLDTTSGQEGLALLDEIRREKPALPVVVMTGWSSIELSVAAMRGGANDFVEKPWDNERLLSIIATQIKLAEGYEREHKLDVENRLLRESLSDSRDDFLVKAAASVGLMETAKQVALSDMSIILYGENGTGKSKLAEHIHQMSTRRSGPFIAVNMGAIPENLFESEMFGHVKGAFTDAKSDRVGRFEIASGGTLFLDEVANIPLSQQAKLLRVLESQEYEPVGSNKTQIADVRVICATNANLNALCEAGEFRKDLMYRLSGMDLHIAPLRDRLEDIMPIVEQQLALLCKKYQRGSVQISDCARDALLAYDWPGNIRELRHCIERALVLTKTQLIHADDLRLVSSPNNLPSVESEVDSVDQEQTLDEIERSIIERRLKKYGGQAVLTANSLGLSRSAFYRRLDKYHIETG